jgi:hypothetical protein
VPPSSISRTRINSDVQNPLLTNTFELADVGLVVDLAQGSEEYDGWLKILGQSHLSFDLVSLAGSDLKR